MHLMRSRWTDRPDDGSGDHDMYCRDRARDTVLWPAHMHTRPLRVHHNNEHTHARTFNRTQGSMHACTTRRAFHEWLDATEGRPRAAPAYSHNSTPTGGSPTTITLSPHAAIYPLPPRLRIGSEPLGHPLAYLSERQVHTFLAGGALMPFEDVVCRHRLLAVTLCRR